MMGIQHDRLELRLGHGVDHGLERRREELLTRGTPIQARFVGVERNTSIEYNGCNPWRLLCQWQDPADASVHVFRSDDIWFDPTEHVPRGSIRVLIDPMTPARYHVDLSFLPALARG